MVQPTYMNSIKRWRYSSLNSKISLNDDSVPLFDDRLIVNLKNVLNQYRLVEMDEYYYTYYKTPKPFLATHERPMFPGSTDGMIVENDPVNTIDTSLDTSIDGNPEIEAERMIGNLRFGLKRQIIHIGNNPTIQQYADLTNSGLTELPLFPPLPSDFSKPDRISLVTTDGGYKDYIKSAYPSASNSALQATELTGRKIIIWDGANSKFIRHVKTTDYSVSADDSKNVDITDIETVVNGASAKGGLADIHANLGTFLPAEKAYTIVNIPGQSVFEITDTKVSIRIYSSDWSTLVSEFSLAKSDGKVVFGDATTYTELTPNGNVIMKAGSTTVTLTKNGTFDVS